MSFRSSSTSSSHQSGRGRRQTTPDLESADPNTTEWTVVNKQQNQRKGPSVSFQTPTRTTSTRNDYYPEDVSPADTFDTVMTSGSYGSDADSPASNSRSGPPTPQKLVIDHNIHSTTDQGNGKRGGGGGGSRAATSMIFGMSKPLIGFGLLMLLGAGGAAAWGWLQIPGLENQVKALEEQVMRLNTEIDRLSGEVDRLEDENDRYQDLNDQLNATVVELEDIRDDLNETVIDLGGIASDLNETTQDLTNQVDELESQNERYAALNRELNNSVISLASEVDYFKEALMDLTLENSILSNMTSALGSLTEQLTNTSVSQNETLTALQDFLQDLMTQNDRLEQFNSDLVTLVSFLNSTSVGLGNSLEDITDFLSNQISVNQGLVLNSLENTYRQRVQNWDCDFRDVFREEVFGNDFSTPIDTQTQLPAVLDYVDQRVLSELCLDVNDFASFLNAANADGTITSFRLIRDVLVYTDRALDYYFPESSERGVPLEEWVDSSFSCEQLPAPFSWTQS
mmetsp:Transcript_6566/g.12094  ORF Transcript_6566/g.12094 Transcript_6566/m.12094 type:complete len:511 (+) Transcript_6566:189-1721(+)